MSGLTTFLTILLAVNAGALVAMTILYRRAKKEAEEASKERRVEEPDAEYRSQYVVDLEAKERWERVDLSRLHEINREEFVKLLERVKGAGTRTLSAGERAFLDRIADAHERLMRREGDDPGRSSPQPQRLPGTS